MQTKTNIGSCSVEGCEKAAFKKAFCSAHYQRQWAHGTTESLTPNRVNGTPEQRFWAKVDPCRTDGCWLWLATLNNRGYGRFGMGNGTILAHHFLLGKPPHGLDWDHLCHNADRDCPGGRECMHKRCVNPAHLELATRQLNSKRGSRKSRSAL